MKLLGYPHEENTLTSAEKISLIKRWGSPLYDAYEVWMPLLDEANVTLKSSLKFDLAYYPIYQNMKFEADCGIIRITIHGGKDLADKKKPTSPFVAVYQNENEIFRTIAKKKTSNPYWEHAHQFYVNSLDSVLTFNVMEDHHLQGQCILNVSESLKSGVWYPLLKGPGMLKISMSFIPIDLSQSLADTEMIPFNEPLGVVKIFLIEGKGLQNVEIIGKSDPYCKVQLNQTQLGVTSAIKNTLDPQWRHTLYGIPYKLEDILRFDIFDYNETLKDKSLGSSYFSIGMLIHELNIFSDSSFYSENNFENLLESYRQDGFKCNIKPGTATTIEV